MTGNFDAPERFAKSIVFGAILTVSLLAVSSCDRVKSTSAGKPTPLLTCPPADLTVPIKAVHRDILLCSGNKIIWTNVDAGGHSMAEFTVDFTPENDDPFNLDHHLLPSSNGIAAPQYGATYPPPGYAAYKYCIRPQDGKCDPSQNVHVIVLGSQGSPTPPPTE